MPALTDQALTDLRMDGADAPVIVDAASEVSSAEPDALRAAVFEQLMLLHAVSGRISDLTVLARTEMQMVLDVQIDSVWKRAHFGAAELSGRCGSSHRTRLAEGCSLAVPKGHEATV
jgi:hypothetical protein